MGKIRESVHRGINLSVLNLLMMAFGAMLAVGMIYAAIQTDENYQELISTTRMYASAQSATGRLEDMSESISEECRDYIETGDPSHVFAYVGQLEALKEQDDAYAAGEADRPQLAEADRWFERARATYLQIVERECYAMRLKAASLPIPLDTYPPRVSGIELTGEDQALEGDQLAQKALDIINAPEMTQWRTEISKAVDESHRAVAEVLEIRTNQTADILAKAVWRQKVFTALLILTAAAGLIVNYLLIIRPINQSIEKLDSRQKIPVRGCYEMRHLARVYNNVLADNESKNQELAFHATHDALTGLYNRAAFDRAYREARDDRVTVIVLDVDHFKHYNDDHGHDTGDRVLQHVSEAIREQFRTEDHLSRMGGDEFCVIMKDTGSEQKELIREKIEAINGKLRSGREGTPPCSISAGVAFWDRENPGNDLFKDADTALLRKKHNSRGGCEFY